MRLFALLLSTVMALVAAELVASALQHGAYPFLNIYQSDDVYGVVLQPEAETAVVSAEGRVTEIATNAYGFRDDPWWPAFGEAVVPKRVLLLGDSQMFGYGVDREDAVGAKLEASLGEGWDVLVGAAPTWGPPEYLRAQLDLGTAFRPEVVVLVLNVANDWFEVNVPNARRTTAQDGWASHKLVGVDEPTDFPGRSWLMGRSHLVLAVRTLLSDRDGPPPVAAVGAGRLLDHLDELRRADPPYRSRLTKTALAAQEQCRHLGCQLLVVTLPLDVQVHDGEWAKYANEEPRDMRRTGYLTASLLADLRQRGVATLDLLPVLRAASPGAFLPDDYHMSPTGHAAIAARLADTLATWRARFRADEPTDVADHRVKETSR